MGAHLLALMAFLLLGCAANACTVNGNYSAEGFACDEQQPCPVGFDCLAGVCSAMPSSFDGGDAPDAGELACLPFVELSDTFDGPDIDAQWIQAVGNGTSLELMSGAVVLTPGTVNPTRFARLRSEKLNFADRRVALEVVQMVNTATAAIGELRVAITASDYFVIRQSAGVLQFGRVELESLDVLAAVPYDAVAHRWLQFREIDGELFGDTSSDGQTWTQLGSVAHNEIPEFRVTIAAGTEERIDEPGSLHIDNVNSGSSLCE